MRIPETVRTERMLLRPWRASDAQALAPILGTNYAHLGPWIPARVATPAPLPELENRLQRFASDFTRSKEWRYAMFMLDSDALLGELSIFPRSAAERVAYEDADRVEVGYWLRQDATGQGLVTEAVRALISVLSLDTRYSCIEIRCDERNAASGAIPRRLGFVLEKTVDGLQVWTLAAGSAARFRAR